MNNAERAQRERNLTKENMSRSFYEISMEKEWKPGEYSVPNEEIVRQICELLIEKGMSYREANEALYHADKVLHAMAVNKSIGR